MLNSFILMAQKTIENEKTSKIKEKKVNQVIYEANTNGYYTTQTMYIITKIMSDGELIFANDKSKNFSFTNLKGKTKEHLIDIEAFNRTSEALKQLSDLQIKNVVEILENNDNSMKILRNLDGMRFKSIISINENGELNITDEESPKEDKKQKDFGTI